MVKIAYMTSSQLLVLGNTYTDHYFHAFAVEVLSCARKAEPNVVPHTHRSLHNKALIKISLIGTILAYVLTYVFVTRLN